MPEYLMMCSEKHKRSIFQNMETDEIVTCEICGRVMWRKPQPVTINWNGTKPSGGEHAGFFQEHMATIDQRRDAIDEKYEKRDE